MGESREQMGERRLGAALWLEVFSFVGPERPHRKTMGVYGIMGRVSQTRSADLFSTHKAVSGGSPSFADVYNCFSVIMLLKARFHRNRALTELFILNKSGC